MELLRPPTLAAGQQALSLSALLAVRTHSLSVLEVLAKLAQQLECLLKISLSLSVSWHDHFFE